MTDNFRALCADAIATLGPASDRADPELLAHQVDEWLRRARAALAEGENPIHLEPAAWLWEYIGSDLYVRRHWLSYAARTREEMDPDNPPFPKDWKPVAPLYRSTPPRPVPVAERLPGPEDCDAEGRCWWFDGTWMQKQVKYRGAYSTHWLPAHAIPLPQENTDAT